MLHLEICHKTIYRMDASVATSYMTDESDEDKNDDKMDKEDASAGTGTIVNLMSTDSQRITDFCTSWFSVYGSMADLYPVLITAAFFYFYIVVQGHALTAPVAFISITVLSELRFSLIFIPGTIVKWMQDMVRQFAFQSRSLW
ncbi:hypothetical protein BC940DRAFT_58610 [Gongronella butleri]|nr:hypothetical protein BC940DRAFT_58610 [Gongronella butleri]